MEYPKKSWCLYLKGVINSKGEDLTKYDGYVGYELYRPDSTQAILKLNNRLGYRETEDKKNSVEFYKGHEILVPVSKLTLGFQSKYHREYLKYSIKSIEENDYLVEDYLWVLFSVFEYYNILNTIIKYKGILNNKTIEEIAILSGQEWSLTKSRTGYILECGKGVWNLLQPIPLQSPPKERESLSGLEALKRYGLVTMDNAIEYCYISFDFERDRKLNMIL